MFNTFAEYQAEALKTWRGKLPGTELGRCYLALKLAGEAGETGEKVGKLIRDKNGLMDIAAEDLHDITLELGDVLWYIAVLADELGIDLEHVAWLNIDKLRDRNRRGKIGGSGDNR